MKMRCAFRVAILLLSTAMPLSSAAREHEKVMAVPTDKIGLIYATLLGGRHSEQERRAMQTSSEQCTLFFPSAATTLTGLLDPRQIGETVRRVQTVFSSLGSIDWTLSGYEIGCETEMMFCESAVEEGACPGENGCMWQWYDLTNPAFGGYCSPSDPESGGWCPQDEVRRLEEYIDSDTSEEVNSGLQQVAAVAAAISGAFPSGSSPSAAIRCLALCA